MSFMTLQEVARYFSISVPTVNNWIRQGLLLPCPEGSGRVFVKEEVYRLNNAIDQGSVCRLNKRANRSRIKKNNSPLFEEFYQILREMPECLSMESKVENLLYGLSLYAHLEKNNKKRNAFLTDWKHDLVKKGQYFDCTDSLEKRDYPAQDINLSELYQKILLPGLRIGRGQYFTPSDIVQRICESIEIPEEGPLWDPCCGFGAFLTGLLNKGVKPGRLFGSDIDPLAIKICRLNILAGTGFDSDSQIVNVNPLTKNPFPGSFSMILTNPPWGREAGADPGSEDLFARFLRLGIGSCQEGGTLAYLLPESILRVARHESIRKVLRENCEIEKILSLGKVFQGVQSAAVLMVLKKVSDKNIKKDASHGPFCIIGHEEKRLLEKIEKAPSRRLLEKTTWLMGIVTGDNERFVSETPSLETVPVLTGRNVKKGGLSEPDHYLYYKRELLQQCGPDNLYKQRKIVYRFIAEDPVFALDNHGYYMLNSVNALIPDWSDLTTEAISTLLNQPVLRFYYRVKFGGVKVLKSNLKNMPVPLIDSGLCCEGSEALFSYLNHYYRLSEAEISLLTPQNR